MVGCVASVCISMEPITYKTVASMAFEPYRSSSKMELRVEPVHEIIEYSG